MLIQEMDISWRLLLGLARRAGMWWHGSGLSEFSHSVNKVVYLRFHDRFSCVLWTTISTEGTRCASRIFCHTSIKLQSYRFTLFIYLFIYYLQRELLVVISCWLPGCSVSHIWITEVPFPSLIIKSTAKLTFATSEGDIPIPVPKTLQAQASKNFRLQITKRERPC